MSLKINIKYVFILYMGKIDSKVKGINTNSILMNSQIDHTKTSNKEFHGKVKIGTTSGLAVVGGETDPMYDPDERDGWLFTKPIADTAKFNYFFYSQGNKAITLADHNQIRHVESNLKIITGEALSTEEVYTISIHSDSGSPASTQILVSTLGLNIYHGDKKIIKKLQLV